MIVEIVLSMVVILEKKVVNFGKITLIDSTIDHDKVIMVVVVNFIVLINTSALTPFFCCSAYLNVSVLL